MGVRTKRRGEILAQEIAVRARMIIYKPRKRPRHPEI